MHIKKLILSLTLGLGIIAAHAQSYTAQTRAAKAFFAQAMQQQRIPGLAFAVVKNGKLVTAQTFGMAQLDWQQPVTEHTNFQIASVSKLLATTLVMKSIANGKLQLADSISRYLGPVPATWQGITIGHLLNHTSGIKMFRQQRQWPVAQVVKAMQDSSLNFTPGTRENYVSGDFNVLLAILEKIYGKPYPDIIKTEVTVPLHMADGAFDRERMVSEWTETDPVSRKAATYYRQGDVLIPYKFFYPQFTYAAGGYFASLSDLVNWAIGLDKQTLFPATLEQRLAYQPDTLLNGRVTGFSSAGWGIDNRGGIIRGGHSGGPALADVLRFPDQGFTFIVLSNDGELLPSLAAVLSTFYIDGLPYERKVNKFTRTKALQ